MFTFWENRTNFCWLVNNMKPSTWQSTLLHFSFDYIFLVGKKELIIKWTGFIICFRGICFKNKSVGGYSTLFHTIIKISNVPKYLFFLEIILEKQQNISKDHHYKYRTRAIITRGLYIFYPLFEVHLCTVTFGLMYG